MRIIHDIDSHAQTTCGASGPYAKRVDQAEPASSFPVRCLIVTTDPISGEEEPIYIEGNAKYIRDALLQLVEQIELLGEGYEETGEVSPEWRKVVDKDGVVRRPA